MDTDTLQSTIDIINNTPSKPMPEGLATVDAMLDGALDMATSFLVGNGPDLEILPTWFIATERGVGAILITPFEDGEDSKETAALVVKKIMAETKAERYVLMTEAWVASYKNDDLPGGAGYKPPAERDDHTEVLVLLGANKGGGAMRIYEMVRDDEGGVIDLKRREKAENAAIGGRFANLLSEETAQ